MTESMLQLLRTKTSKEFKWKWRRSDMYRHVFPHAAFGVLCFTVLKVALEDFDEEDLHTLITEAFENASEEARSFGP